MVRSCSSLEVTLDSDVALPPTGVRAQGEAICTLAWHGTGIPAVQWSSQLPPHEGTATGAAKVTLQPLDVRTALSHVATFGYGRQSQRANVCA